MQKETEDKQRCKSIKHSENNSIEMAYTNNSQTCRIINPKHVQLHKSTKSFPHTVYSANAHHGRKIKAFNRHTHTHTSRWSQFKIRFRQRIFSATPHEKERDFINHTARTRNSRETQKNCAEKEDRGFEEEEEEEREMKEWPERVDGKWSQSWLRSRCWGESESGWKRSWPWWARNEEVSSQGSWNWYTECVRFEWKEGCFGCWKWEMGNG